MADTDAMFDKVADKLEARQAETGVKLLWGTCNLFSHTRYMHGSATNPDPAVLCRAAAQVCGCARGRAPPALAPRALTRAIAMNRPTLGWQRARRTPRPAHPPTSHGTSSAPYR